MALFAKLFDAAQQRKRKAASNDARSDVKSRTDASASLASAEPHSNEQARGKSSHPRKKPKRNDPHPTETSTDNRKQRRPVQPNNVASSGEKRRARPSPAVLDFSAKLKDLSRQRKMDELVTLYWNSSYDAIRDEHHACIVIDACARSGDVSTAETIVSQLARTPSPSRSGPDDSPSHFGATINVETRTALLKVYVHAGNMQEASNLFRSIANPNVRTLNTLLRGCLWSAASVTSAVDTSSASVAIVGGVVTSEEAWTLYQKAFPNASDTLDDSSYEYSIVLLSQALRVNEAEARIDAFCQARDVRIKKGKASISGPGTTNQSVLETLAVVYLSLARAYALLDQPNDQWRACQRSLSAIKASRAILLDTSSDSTVSAAAKADKTAGTGSCKGSSGGGGASGGKRGWKHKDSTNHGATAIVSASSDRSASNTMFRAHRSSELESDVLALLKRNKNAVTISRPEMALRIRNRLLYFAGGAATTTSPGGKASQQGSRLEARPLKQDHMISSWHNFGLSQFATDTTTACNPGTPSEMNAACGLPNSTIVQSDGKIDFREVFPDSKRPLDIEIGAGFGSWIVQQAQVNLLRNYVAVELRADRCFQIFCHATLEAPSPLPNVCVVGSECCSFLRDRIQPGSVSTIYANFPEPPTQTFGDNPRVLAQIADGSMKEPSHMLHSPTIVAMGRSLQRKGRIILVSDNRSHARLLAATVAKVVRENKSWIRSIPPKELPADDTSSLRHWEALHGVDVYTQSESGDNKGTSYFDRLWRTGAGRRSEKCTRFVILMKRL